MLVYHTSYAVITHPDIIHSRNYLDFGKGFYVTTLREQAEKYAARIAIRNKKPILNVYELSNDFSAFSRIKFEHYDEKWLDYVASCRDGRAVECYDIIEGGVANDKVFDTIDLYFSGRMSKDDALRRLVYEQPNWQICLASQKIIDQNLKFLYFEEL